eukprot:9489153-Pyramimonas_sp.AAC.2
MKNIAVLSPLASMPIRFLIFIQTSTHKYLDTSKQKGIPPTPWGHRRVRCFPLPKPLPPEAGPVVRCGHGHTAGGDGRSAEGEEEEE